MVRQAKAAEEHRVALVCHNNPNEFFGYVNKHKPRAPLGPVFSADEHLLTNDEEMATSPKRVSSRILGTTDPSAELGSDTLKCSGRYRYMI